MSAAEIHRDLCAAGYCKNVMSEGTVKDNCIECLKMGGQMFTIKCEVIGHLQ
jgi:hypothetical protein